MKEIEALPAKEQLAFKSRKLACDKEYYTNFARKSFFYGVGILITVFLAITAWNWSYAHTNITDISEEQIRHEGKIARLEEKHGEVMDKLNGIETLLKDIEKSLP